MAKDNYVNSYLFWYLYNAYNSLNEQGIDLSLPQVERFIGTDSKYNITKKTLTMAITFLNFVRPTTTLYIVFEDVPDLIKDTLRNAPKYVVTVQGGIKTEMRQPLDDTGILDLILEEMVNQHGSLDEMDIKQWVGLNFYSHVQVEGQVGKGDVTFTAVDLLSNASWMTRVPRVKITYKEGVPPLRFDVEFSGVTNHITKEYTAMPNIDDITTTWGTILNDCEDINQVLVILQQQLEDYITLTQ